MSQESNYIDPEQDSNDVETEIAPVRENMCHRCRGMGTDRDGADCLDCQGWGSIITRY